MGLGTGEIILIVVVVMLVFGATKLPQLGDGLGKAIGSFKRAVSGANEVVVSTKKSAIDGAGQAETQDPAKPADKTTF